MNQDGRLFLCIVSTLLHNLSIRFRLLVMASDVCLCEFHIHMYCLKWHIINLLMTYKGRRNLVMFSVASWLLLMCLLHRDCCLLFTGHRAISWSPVRAFRCDLQCDGFIMPILLRCHCTRCYSFMKNASYFQHIDYLWHLLFPYSGKIFVTRHQAWPSLCCVTGRSGYYCAPLCLRRWGSMLAMVAKSHGAKAVSKSAVVPMATSSVDCI